MKKINRIILGALLAISITACSDEDIVELFQQGQEQALVRAVLDGDEKRVRSLIDQGVSLNISGDDKSSPLYWSIAEKKFDMARFLMENGADPYQELKSGHTVLTMAAAGHTWALEFLLDAGLDPNSSGGYAKSAVCWAIGRTKWENVDLLFEAGADVNYMGPNNLSVGECAASVGRYDKVLEFLDMGLTADLEGLGKWAGRRSSRSYEQERAKVVSRLREKGVSVEIKPHATLPKEKKS